MMNLLPPYIATEAQKLKCYHYKEINKFRAQKLLDHVWNKSRICINSFANTYSLLTITTVTSIEI